MTSSYLRAALVLPPVQSFNMPYSAPAMLASVLQDRFGAQTLVIDAGVEWLWSEMDAGDPSLRDDLTALQRSETYRDAFTLRDVYLRAEAALRRLCASWAPEEVKLSGEYSPPGRYRTWADVEESLGLSSLRLFDRYFRHVLIPRLRRFRPQIIGLSVPYDWMLWPALRLLRLLRRSCPDGTTIVGGPAIQRLWNEGQTGFFEIVDARYGIALYQAVRPLQAVANQGCPQWIPARCDRQEQLRRLRMRLP